MRPGGSRTAPPPPTAGAVEATDAAIRKVIRGHTCEAGVRELARQLGAVGRFVTCLRWRRATPPRSPSSPTPTRPRASIRPASVSPWPRSWDRRGTTRCPTAYVTRSRGSAPASRACSPPTSRPPPPPGSRWWRSCRGGGRQERPGAPAALRRAFDREHVGRNREKDQAIDYLVALRPPRSDTRPATSPTRPSSCVSADRPASAEPRSRGRWPGPSAGGSSASPWPASRTRRPFTGSPAPPPNAVPERLVRALRGLGPASAPCPTGSATTRWSSSASSTGPMFPCQRSPEVRRTEGPTGNTSRKLLKEMGLSRGKKTRRNRDLQRDALWAAGVLATPDWGRSRRAWRRWGGPRGRRGARVNGGSSQGRRGSFLRLPAVSLPAVSLPAVSRPFEGSSASAPARSRAEQAVRCGAVPGVLRGADRERAAAGNGAKGEGLGLRDVSPLHAAATSRPLPRASVPMLRD